MHMMQARACGQPPLRQASVFSPVPNGSGYPLLCHGNILLTRPSPPVKGVLTRGPGRRGVDPRPLLPWATGVQPRRGSWRVFRPAAAAKRGSMKVALPRVTDPGLQARCSRVRAAPLQPDPEGVHPTPGRSVKSSQRSRRSAPPARCRARPPGPSGSRGIGLRWLGLGSRLAPAQAGWKHQSVPPRRGSTPPSRVSLDILPCTASSPA